MEKSFITDEIVNKNLEDDCIECCTEESQNEANAKLDAILDRLLHNELRLITGDEGNELSFAPQETLQSTVELLNILESDYSNIQNKEISVENVTIFDIYGSNQTFCDNSMFVGSKTLTNKELLHILDSSEEEEDNIKQMPTDDLIQFVKKTNDIVHKASNCNCSAETLAKEKNISDRRRIVKMSHFIDDYEYHIERHSLGGMCENRKFKLIESVSIGLKSRFIIQCENCKYSAAILSEPETELMDLNAVTVAATVTTGSGYSQLNELLSAMDIVCMSSTSYRKYHEQLYDAFRKSAEQSMKKAGELEKKLALERGDLIKGVPVTKVIADGTYLRRTYPTGRFDSNSGMAIIVGYYTQQILFMGVRNKYCFICSRAEQNGNFAGKHKCYRNFDPQKSSSAMEADIISEGFRCSVEQHGLIYEYLIADGDSNVYIQIQKDNPNEEYDVPVKKIECTNHLLRNLCKKLKKVGKGKKNVAKWKNLVEDNIMRLRRAITKAIQHRADQEISTEEKINRLRSDINNVPYHIFGDHSNCDSYFCTGPKENEVNNIPEMEKVGIIAEIEEALDPVVSECRSLLQQMNNNIVENCNSVLAKLITGKRINWGLRGSYEERSYASVTQNNDQTTLSSVAVSSGKTPSDLIVSLEKKRKLANDTKKIDYHLSRMFGERKFKNTIVVENGDKHYGDNCQKPDLDGIEYKAKHEKFWEKLKNLHNVKDQIEQDTRNKYDYENWNELQKKMLLDIYFKSICSKRETTPVKNLVKNITVPKEKKSRNISYESTNEKKAIELYEKKTNQKIQKCGLMIDNEIPFLAANPTGLIGNDGIIMIKCPYFGKTGCKLELGKEGKGELKNLCTLESETINKNHELYYRIQGQLRITRRTYCDLFMWTPLETKLLRIQRDEIFWSENMETQLVDFYKQHIVPELVDSRIKRRMPIRESHTASEPGVSEKKK